MKKPKVLTPELLETLSKAANLAIDIEDIVWDKDITFIEAALYYCEKNNVEIEAVAELISKNDNLMNLIREEGEKSKLLLPSGNTLSAFLR